ncbi:MAG: hypothetical protein WC052_00615 [Patescibacteria group bacterium]|jgi:hypothetical protein
MDVNFLSSERRKREVEERERLAKQLLPAELHEAEGLSNSPQLKTVRAVPTKTEAEPAKIELSEVVQPVIPTVMHPAAVASTISMHEPETQQAKPAVDRSISVPPPVAKKNSAPHSATVEMVRGPEAKKHKTGMTRTAGRLVEYAALLSIVVVVFVSGVAIGVSMRRSPAPVAPVVSGISLIEHEAAMASARDVLRLAHVALIQESLDEYWRQNEARFPSGVEIVLGTDTTQCLGAAGWISRDSCILPVNPSDNRIYLSAMPRDPGTGTYRYTVLEAGRAYRLEFTLETDAPGFKAGPQQRTGGAVPAAEVAS